MTVDILINIDVDDLAKASSFYERAFHLQPARRFGSFAVEMIGGSSPVYLLGKAQGTRASPKSDALRHYGRHWTPVHLDFVVPDADAAVSTAISAGATLEGE